MLSRGFLANISFLGAAIAAFLRFWESTAMSDSAIMNTYSRLPVVFDRGEGVFLYDEDGNQYLDGIGGIAVNTLGHAHPAVTKAIADQAAKLLHTSNLYQIRAQQQLADRLIALSGMNSCFFSNSGAEANEAAIKVARLYGHKRGIKKPGIIVVEGAFHGRTMATLSATGNRKIQAGFEPLVAGFVRAPFNDLEALRHIATNNPDIVAILVEPILGEGGVIPSDEGYLEGIRQLCDDQDWLMMLDEVQTGNGRTGTFFRYQASHLLPDVVTVAKGLANGVPIGACLVAGAATDTMGPGNHGSTFGGNPLACATALAVLDTIERDDLIGNASRRGEQIITALSARLDHCAMLKEIRGEGLMIGIELQQNCPEMVDAARARGVLINVTAGSTIRLLPPLILSESEAETLIAVVAEIILEFAAQHLAA